MAKKMRNGLTQKQRKTQVRRVAEAIDIYEIRPNRPMRENWNPDPDPDGEPVVNTKTTASERRWPDEAQLGVASVADEPLLGAGASNDAASRVNRPHPPNPPASEAFDAKAKARFWRKVSPAPSDACWIFRGAIGTVGYGNVGRFGRTYLAHRVAYELANGPVPEGKDLDHLCRVRECVNPAHLEPVTFLANMRRRYAENPDERPTHCLSSHELTPENTQWVLASGQRTCRTCASARGRGEAS